MCSVQQAAGPARTVAPIVCSGLTKVPVSILVVHQAIPNSKKCICTKMQLFATLSILELSFNGVRMKKINLVLKA
jgi:hypothetical protein